MKTPLEVLKGDDTIDSIYNSDKTDGAIYCDSIIGGAERNFTLVIKDLIQYMAVISITQFYVDLDTIIVTVQLVQIL